MWNATIGECTTGHATGSHTVLPKQNKMSAFHAQKPTQTCVWHCQKLAPHHTKNKKDEVSPDFLLF